MKILYWAVSPAGRAWLYRVTLAILALLVAYGVVSDGEVPSWSLLIGALFGMGAAGTAVTHVTPADPGTSYWLDLGPEDDQESTELTQSLEDPK